MAYIPAASACQALISKMIRPGAKKIFFCGIGIFLAVLLFVVIMQITDTNTYDILRVDPKTGLETYKPNTSYLVSGSCFDNVAKINNLGFHGPDVVPAKKEGVFRIVVVGSSYAEARQVGWDDMYSSILQEKLNALPDKKYQYEVIPLGVNGNGTMLDTLYYINYGRALSPDLVIDIESEFELLNKTDASALGADGKVTLTVPTRSGGALQQLSRLILRHSNFAVDMYNRVLVLSQALQALLHSPQALIPGYVQKEDATQNTGGVQADWNLKENLLDNLAHEVGKDSAQFVLASWMSASAPANIVAEYPVQMEKTAEAGGFSYADLLPSVLKQESAEGGSTSLSCDAHWSVDGNRYIGEALFGYLTAHPSLIEKK